METRRADEAALVVEAVGQAEHALQARALRVADVVAADIVDTADIVEVVDTVDIVDTVDTLDTVHTVDKGDILETTGCGSVN